MSRTSRLVLAAAATFGLAACSATSSAAHHSTVAPPVGASSGSRTAPPAFGLAPDGLPVYAHTMSLADISPVARKAKDLVYVPEQLSGRVQVIDPHTFKIIATYDVAASPEHVVPSYDERTLWVNSDAGYRLTPINPNTGKPGRAVRVAFPYNLYFTPGGVHALVMAEALDRIDVRNPHTMALQHSLHVPCNGVNHADFTANLTSFVASCEFSGKLLVVNSDATHVEKVIDLNAIHTPGATNAKMAKSMGGPAAGLDTGASSMPQDVRLAPDGKHFLIADMLRNGVWVFNARTFAFERFVRTGKGAHGIYPSRNGKEIYVSNRDEGSISVLDAQTLKPIAKWWIPGGGSPDMGGLSADGTQLWLSGRYNSVVYVFDTRTGKVIHKISVYPGPHGLLVWPQPGRFSLGHTGNMR